ncbi:MAG: hypothetical protein O7A98_03615, partial [Acidobacteria bacterium]|nr:hypothetical protein [Acidobacteriota bacterium]
MARRLRREQRYRVPVLVPHLTADRLGVIELKNYGRNLLMGPPGMQQMEWLRAASDHLMDGLRLEPISMNVLLQLCDAIIRRGQVATIPRVLGLIEERRLREATHRALQNRLLDLTMSGGQFDCEHGHDLSELFQRSIIFNLKGASEAIRRLICYDHYVYLTHSRPQLT